MKKLLLGVAFTALMSSSAFAAKIGVSMAMFDDNFLTVLRNGMIEQAKGMDGVAAAGRGRAERRRQAARPDQELRRFGRRRDHRQPGRHLGDPGDVGRCGGRPRFRWSMSTASRSMSTRCPTTRPSSLRTRRDSGTLETKEVCRLFKEAGKTEANVYVIMGELSNQAAVQRTKDIARRDRRRRTAASIKIIDKQTSNWNRDEAQNLMTNWLSTGKPSTA